jgi:type II secretory pathway component GspD/PulD (secretin)
MPASREAYARKGKFFHRGNKVKRGGRALLWGAALAIALCSAAFAKSNVTLVGINATQDGNAAVIELHTSGPADFTLDRFTMGQWLTVWSNRFELADGVKEIPLQFDRAELADMVTGLSLVHNRQAGAVRVYLGASADMRGSTIEQDGDVTRIRVPLKGDLKPKTVSFQSRYAVRSKEDTPGPDAQDAQDAAQTASSVSEDAGQGAAGSGLMAMATPATDTKANADLSSDDTSKLLEATTRLAKESLAQEDTQSNASFQPGPAAKPAATQDFYTPFNAGMKPVSGFNAQVSNAMPVNGKDALNGVKIDKYEIMDQPLDQALTLLVAPTGFNVIVDSEVGKDHNVTLSFKDHNIDLRSALDLLTKSYKLDYVVQAGTIVVGTKDRLEGGLEDYETRLFILSYAQPSSVKQMLMQTGLLQGNQVEIYNESVSGSKGGGGTAGGGAAGATGGGAAGSEGAGATGGSTGGSSGGGSGGGGSTGGGSATSGMSGMQPDSNLVSTTPQNAILVKAVPEQMDRIAAVIKNIDRRPQLVEMEVRVCEANDNALRDLGLELNGAVGATPLSASDLTKNANNGFGEIWSEQPTPNVASGQNAFEAFSTGSFMRGGLAFSASLSHEIQTGNVKLLAQPTLTTVEGKPATYFAGDHIPYISQPANNTGGASQAAQVDYIDVGIKLNFTPRLDDDGMVTIDVNPEVSSLVQFIALDNQGSQAPQTSTRELHTRVRVGSCQPFVLAGMITDKESEAMSKIPGLGNLPWVGHLFRHTTKSKQRTEIIIVVVPKVKD